MQRITKDTAIRVSGLLQAIMSNPNIEPKDWPEKLEAALIIHKMACHKYEKGGTNGKAAKVVEEQD